MPHRRSHRCVIKIRLHSPDEYQLRLHRSFFPPRLGPRSFAPRRSASLSNVCDLSPYTLATQASVPASAKFRNILVMLPCLYLGQSLSYCTNDYCKEPYATYGSKTSLCRTFPTSRNFSASANLDRKCRGHYRRNNISIAIFGCESHPTRTDCQHRRHEAGNLHGTGRPRPESAHLARNGAQ